MIAKKKAEEISYSPSINNSDINEQFLKEEEESSDADFRRDFPITHEEKIEIKSDKEIVEEQKIMKKEIQGNRFEQIFKVEGRKNVKTILTEPIIPPSQQNPNTIIERIKTIVNGKRGITMAGKFGYFGVRLIKPGHIGILQNVSSGKLNVVGPGRWTALDPYVKWKGIFSIDQKIIKVENLTICDVDNGYYGLCTNNTYPFVLKPGKHVYLSKVFQFVRQVPINQAHIEFKTVHLINVPKGKLSRIFLDQVPILLEHGIHVFVSSMFHYVDMISETMNLIQHGTITRFRVTTGNVVICWNENNEPAFFTKPGIYVKDSPNFKYVREIDAKAKYYGLGARKNITVYAGEVGVSFKKGKLEILEAGFHEINDSLHIFDQFMNIKQQCLNLSHGKQRLILEMETKDLVKVGIKAALFYKIDDPKLAIVEIGESKEIEKFLLETSIACLNSIVRSTALSNVAKSVESPHDFKTKGQKETPVPLFFERAHDEFLFKLHDSFLKKYGLNIVDLRIESFDLLSKELAQSISKQAIVTAQTQTELANLEGQREVQTQIQNREAEVQAIKNKIFADKIAMETNTKVQAKYTEVETKAKSDLLLAETQAKSITLLAKAKADAKKLMAEGEAEYIKKIGSSPLGKEYLLLKLKTEMIEKCLQNTSKVVYLDSNNPLSLFNNMLKKVDEVGLSNVVQTLAKKN